MQDMQEIQKDFTDLRDMIHLKYVRPILRNHKNPIPASLVVNGIPGKYSQYIGHKFDGTNMKLRKDFVDKMVIGIDRDENTFCVNAKDKTRKFLDPECFLPVRNDFNVTHTIPVNIQGNIIKMGMNYGKISENLIHSLSRKKDESINARVQKDDGSFIYFPIEQRFITDHFNMYVEYIHFLQMAPDGRFQKILKGCC